MQKKFLASVLFSAFIGFTITGCSSLSSTLHEVFVESGPAFLSLDEAKEQLQESKPIDDIFKTKNIYNVTKSADEDFRIDLSNADSYNFSSGKSFFRVFQLPINTAYLAIDFNVAISTTTFLPRVDFYNKDYKLISSLKSSAFKYRDSQLGNGVLNNKLIINNANAKPGREFAYMVIYTTDQAQTTKTPIINPVVKQAKALRNNVYEAPDILIPHAPIGEINIVFSFKEQEENIAENLISYLDDPLFGGEGKSNRQENVVLANGEVYSISSQSEGSTAVTSVDSKGNTHTPDQNAAYAATLNHTNTSTSTQNQQNQPIPDMLPETEKMYNDLIKKAVEEGDIAKAMNLVSEAQRAGSLSAQQAFIDAIPKLTK